MDVSPSGLSAADQKAVVDQIKAHNQAATTAYTGGKWDQMKSVLEEAVTLANENGLVKHAALAQHHLGRADNPAPRLGKKRREAARKRLARAILRGQLDGFLP